MEKRKLYIITLEKIEQRYTKQWYDYFKPAFAEFFDVEYIDGVIGSDKIEKGKFLDINKTNKWKAEQVIKISNLFSKGKIKRGDKFFFADGWHFGITALKYMSQLNNIPIKIYTYFHAGTYDDYDFITQAGLRSWACNNEMGWFQACDMHFVATKYHKKLIVDRFGEQVGRKIRVVGFPMIWDQEVTNELGHIKKSVIKKGKRNLVVFPHRLDMEKQPQVFDELERRSKTDYEFVKTLEVTKNKKEYYNLIKDAKIVFSANLQETYGIGTVEATLLGAVPIVPNRLAYLEMYPKEFRYKDLSDAIYKIRHYIENFDKPVIQRKLNILRCKLRQKSSDSIPKMARLMLK